MSSNIASTMTKQLHCHPYNKHSPETQFSVNMVIRLARVLTVPAGFRFRSRSRSLRANSTNGSNKDDERTNLSDTGNGKEDFESNYSTEANKIMVVVDSSPEAKGALEWTLSHTVQDKDTLFLLHVIKPSKTDVSRMRNIKAYKFLHSLKNMCQARKPGIQVVVALQEGKEKGPVIVEAARQQTVQLLVLGQKKQRVMWRFLRRWVVRRKNNNCGVVEYCIQNADCMTIAVKRKGKKVGGYLITTKRHKNFWLLA